MRFKEKHPELFRQLHPTRNTGVDLDSTTNSSHEMLWWRCPAGHEWRETPLQRRSPAAWKNGDLHACLYCVAPGAIVHSCGHRRFQPSESTFRVLPHPCRKCEVTEHARLILDAHDDSAAAAIRLLDDSPLYALFCARAADTVGWWDQIFPLVEAYFVRMVSVYVAIAAVEHRPAPSYPTSSLLGACMLRILDALPPLCREEMHAAVPDDAGHFRHTYLPGGHDSEIGWALKKLGFDILDTPLDGDIERRLQFCEQQRFTATGELPPVNLADRHYPPFTHLPRDRDSGALSELRGFRPKQPPPRITAVRVTLAESCPADPDDPLGRTHLGYAPGLTPPELWKRGRGVWKLRADHVAASTIILIVFDKTIVLVASVTGLTLHRGGVAILGEPVPDHPLIGRPDPLHTPNPLAHGVIKGEVERGGRESEHRIRTSPWRPAPIPLPRTAY
ncbi:zinc-ribbon domain-containing protein [Rhodococcus sp. IEGM 1351]|uniref:zinc-ribbon domain-containing protein n=1 Tax=Rhodococcus sp. IEGM 1351 TaxID=3047089 RepID=UPI0024B6F7C6|nr:zinc-ribbon domain-containing protein [Rhodococcus sp. IEGM 1351]MDI9940329.1 zinc-ribbon domain-containing protein [Rhodococcus sp. IEGM 1351]